MAHETVRSLDPTDPALTAAREERDTGAGRCDMVRREHLTRRLTAANDRC
jgi:hypothetical protein